MKLQIVNKMIKFTWILTIFLILSILLNVLISQPKKKYNIQSPIIYFNGAIFTLEKDKQGKDIIEQSIRTENGIITHIGKNEKTIKLKNNKTKLVDLNGKSVFPAFVNKTIEDELIMGEVFYEMNIIKKAGFRSNSNEKINLFLEAFRNLTIKQAIINKTETKQGSLSPGKLANFIILDKNPLIYNPTKYNEIKVFKTVYEGHFFIYP